MIKITTREEILTNQNQSTLTTNKMNNDIINEPIKLETEEVDSVYGYVPPSSNVVYLVNIDGNTKEQKKQKQPKNPIKKAKRELIELLVDIDTYKAKLRKTNPFKDGDEIKKLNIKISNTNDKINRIEREYGISSSMVRAEMNMPEGNSLGNRIKEAWTKFIEAIKNFVIDHYKGIVAAASVTLLIVQCIFRFTAPSKA